MNEQDFENLKDLRFTITEEMKDTIIEIAFTNQILDECELSFKDRKLLEKHSKKLKRKFALDLQAHNRVQVEIMRAYISGKKEIDQ